MTPQTTPLEISEEAKTAALREVYGHYIQLAINSATAKLREERDAWKASHDNQVNLRRALMDRPDLKERANLVSALAEERDQLKLRVGELEKENYQLKECLEPGKASAIVSGLFREAERLGFYQPTGEHALSQFVKEIESLQKQIVGLRKALDIQNRASHAIVTKSPDALRLAGLSDKYYLQAINETTNFFRLYVRREVLEKVFVSVNRLKTCLESNGIRIQSDNLPMDLEFGAACAGVDEALTLARKELGEC